MLTGTLSIEKKVSSKGTEFQVITFTCSKTGKKLELGTEFTNPTAIAKVLSTYVEVTLNSK